MYLLPKIIIESANKHLQIVEMKVLKNIKFF